MHTWAAVAAGFGGLVAAPLVGDLIARVSAGGPLLRRRARRDRRASMRDHLVVGVAVVTLFAAMGLRFGLTPALPAYLYLVAVSVALAAIDVDLRRLPNVLTLPSYPIGIALLGAAAIVAEHGLVRFGHALAGMAALWLCYALLFLLHPDGLGWGDVKLAGVCGLYLGWLGAGVWVVGAILAFALGATYGLALVGLRRANRKTPIPFGPFMIAGTMLAILAGGPLAGYLGA